MLEQHVFIVMELHSCLSSYMERRQSVLKVCRSNCTGPYLNDCTSLCPVQSLSEFKLALKQQSSDSPHPLVGPLALCNAVHKFHFQLLVLLGSYVKLLALLEKPMQTSPVCRTKLV